MLRNSLFAAALLAASAGVMADGGTRVYGSVVIADPSFSVAISSAPHFHPGYYAWTPPPGRYVYYPAGHYYRHKHHHHHHHRDARHHDHGDWDRPGPHGR